MTVDDFLSQQSPERIAKIKSGDRAEAEALANEYNQTQAPAAPAAPVQSFTKAEAPAFLGTIEKINPVLHSRIKNGDAAAAQEALDLDARYFARFQATGLADLQEDDLDYFRWANARGLTQSDESGLSRFGNGLLNMVKGAGSLLLTAGGVVAGNPGDIAKFAATAVEGAQQGVSEYKMLGAGAAAMSTGKVEVKALRPFTSLPGVTATLAPVEQPELQDAAKFELTRYAQAEERAQGEWRRRIGGEAFAAVEVDPNAVEVMSEITDVSNLAGAGLGKAAVTKAATAGLLPEAIAKAALTEAKLFRPGVSGSLSALEGQARVLSAQSIAAREALLAAEQKVTSARLTAAQLADADRAEFLKATVKPLEAEAETARKGFIAVETKLTENRNAVTAALDSEGVSVADAVAGRATAAVGSAVERVGEGLSNAWRKVRDTVLDGADSDPVFETAIDSATGGASAVARKGNLVTRAGRDLKVIGEIWAQGEATLPFYKRLRQSERAGKLTKGAAAFIDWSNLGWAAGKTSEFTKSALAGAPVSGAFGYVASGGDVDAALESAGAGAAFGIGGGVLGQWEAYSTPGARYEELLGNRRAFRQWLSDSGDRGSQLALFDKLDSVNQLLIATYAHAAPDVAFMFEQGGRGGPAGRYDRERNVIVLNTDHKDPVAQTFAHEVAHFVERHGLQNQVRDAYLGNAETGQIGEFTKIVDGKPAVIEGTNPDGSKSRKFELNDEGRKLKEQYESAVRKFQPDYVLSDEGFASELFAEAYANRIFSGEFLRDLRGGPVEALANSSLVKGFLGKVGMVFDAEGKVIGTGLFDGVRRNRSVEKLIREYNRQSAKGARGEISDDVDLELTEEALKNADVAVKWLQAGGSMKFDAEGKPVYNTDGTPQFLTAKEADQVQRDLAAEIVKGLDEHIAANPDGDAVQRREITDVNGQKRVLYAGAYIPSEVIDKIEAQKRFNPHQLAFLRAASQTVRQNGPGAMIAHFYQAATKKGSKGYKSVAGRWRRDGIYGFQITSEGNITVSSFSWEQLFENARKASRTKKARELWGTSGEALDAAIAGDAVQYLQNLAGKEPGATLLGEDKRDFLNNLLGIRMKGNEGANPFFETTASPKTIITSLRLDRMNRFTPLDVVEYAWGPEQYRRAKENLTPGGSTDEESTGTAAEGEGDDMQLSPGAQFKSGKPLDGSLGDKDVKLFRLSGRPGHKTADPAFFGLSKTVSPSEMTGLNKAYFYVEGQKDLGADREIIGKRPYRYKATVWGGKIYNLDKDKLGWFDLLPNRVKADQMLLDKGFVGVFGTRGDNVRQVMMFKKTKVEQLSPGAIFGSPETESADLETATKNLKGSRQAAYKAVAEDVAPDGAAVDVIGDWADGAENSVGLFFDSNASMDRLRVAAAKLGLYANQKGMIFYVHDENGPDGLHKITFPGATVAEARKALADAGIEFRSISPAKDAPVAYVIDSGRTLFDKVEKLTQSELKPQIDFYPIRSEFIGSWNSRAEGLREYRRILRQAGEDRGSGASGDQGLGDSAGQQFSPGSVSTVAIRSGAEKIELGDKPSVNDIAGALAARSRKLKRIPYDSRTDGAKDAAAEALADEIAYAASLDRNAIGWYERKINEAMSSLQQLHPELEDPNISSFYKAVLAITSNGQAVIDNFARAEELYRGWKEVGRLETKSNWGGARTAQINQGLANLQKLVDLTGLESTRQFLMKEFRFGEIKRVAKDILGVDLGASEPVDHVVRGAIIFGPKVGGGFFPNLNGDFTPVTMDLWLMRTWNRINGSYGVADPVGMGRALARLRAAAAENPGHPESAALSNMSDRQLGNWAEKRFYEWRYTRKFKDADVFDRPAKAFTEAKEGAAETPRNGSERAWIREIFKEIDVKLAARGLPAINNADKQALLWYYEKDLYKALGYRDSRGLPADYADAARKVLETANR